MSDTVPGPAWQIVVLSWNGREDTLRCLESLRRLERDDVAVVCVDNGSADGTEEAVTERFPEVTFIQAAANRGYSGGNNLGIRHALDRGAQWVVLVNNDATVDPGVIDGFEAAACQRPRAGVLAGMVMTTDDPPRIWFAGQRVNTCLGYSGRPRGYGRLDGPAYSRVVDTDRAVGALMAVSRDALTRVGLLDEDLFAYVEDVDLCLRVRGAGLEIVVAPEARAWHRVSASTGGEAASTYTLYYGTRNTIVVYERRRPLPPAQKLLRRAVILSSFGLHALTRADRRAALAAVVAGARDALRGRMGPRPG
jgi:GT2 family glycosyltransferase